MKLTDTAIRKNKPTGRVQKMSDGGGLRLELTAAGSKVFKYRFKLDEKDSDYIIGQYPAVSLSEARRLRDEAKHLVKQGVNPNQKRQQDRAEQKKAEEVENKMTFRKLYDEFAEFKTKAYGDREPQWHGLATIIRTQRHVKM
ncbi:Arm DNA-binding domain-containing protein [Vibrio sp.]|uniref:Arm DNA-binding domain-containing protein n=1 Tax=Vibrio sp. TaxID=678 RepID=UPI003D110316